MTRIGEKIFNRHLELLNELIRFSVEKGYLASKKTLSAPKRGRIAKPHLPDSSMVGKIKNAGEELKLINPLYIYNEDGTYTDEILRIYNKKV